MISACIQHTPLIPTYLPLSAGCQHLEVLSPVLQSLPFPLCWEVRQLPKWQPTHMQQSLCSLKNKLQLESGAWASSLLVRRLQTPAVAAMPQASHGITAIISFPLPDFCLVLSVHGPLSQVI